MALGDTARLSAEVLDQFGRTLPGAAVSWASADASVAAVDSTGLVTAAGAGATTVTATADSVSGSAAVTVMQSAGSVVVSPPSATVAPGDTVRLSAEALDANGHPVAGAEFAWSSSDASVATVDGSGLVTGVGEGSATVTAAAGDVRGTSEITVANPDRGALVALYEATDGPNWVNNDGWLTDAPLGEWFGVWANGQGRVVSVDLNRNGLKGTIPPALGSLADLEQLLLGRNDLSGPIPPELGSLAKLLLLDLGSNDLSGPIPPELGNLEGVQSLRLWSNHLSGPIPREFGDLAELRWLNLARNRLTGTVPSELGRLSNLRRLELARNELMQSIPPELANLANLEHLGLGDNKFSGPIPPELGSLLNLTGLNLSRNDLSGSIPPELGSLANLRSLGLNGNGLTGPIPPELGSLAHLEGLWLSENGLMGSIPPELGSLANLWGLSVASNGLTGPIPPELGSLLNLTGLNLAGNKFSGPIPPELGELANLEQLLLGGNDLSGPIPPELGNLANLHTLNLEVNRLSGPIPPELGALAELRYLRLWRNRFTGSIPPELGNLSNLEILGIVLNNLTGPVPQSFPQLGRLRGFWVFQGNALCLPATSSFTSWLDGLEEHEFHDGSYGVFCNAVDMAALKSLYTAAGGPGWTNSEGWLGGPVVDGWYGVSADSLGHVTALDLSDNGLSGGLPASLSDLTQMTELVVGGNPGLAGRLPPSLARLSLLRRLDYAGTGLCAPAEATFREWLGSIPSHESTGVECAALSDRAILEALYHATGGPDWVNSENWLTGAPLSDWYGVETDAAGRVVRLELGPANGLTGSIPPELGSLANLSVLSLAWNGLTGSIPPELGSLANLSVLSLAGNGLTGPIPPGLGSLAKLSALSLHGNGLTGPIPPELGSLANLSVLSLAGNGMTGPIPPELGSLANLSALLLGGNGLTGSIPPELGSLANLSVLALAWNGLTGSIPPELGSLASLTELSLAGNDLSGPIPPELGDLASLRTLSLDGNDLSGPIPPELGSLSSLRTLSLDGNDLSDAIPPELGSLSNLRTLSLAGNNLSGPLPPELGRLTSLVELVLSRNAGLAGTLPAGLTNLRSLESLQAGGTMLCAPSDADFTGWLETIPSRRVALCVVESAGAYLVQAVQSREFPVPLVAREEALLRVFPTAARANDAPIPPVRASFFLGGALAHAVDIAGTPGPVPTEVDEGSLARSANAAIPAEVVRPGLELVVEIDPDGTLDPALAVRRRIPETGRLAVDVRTMPVFNLTVVPFLSASAPDSSVLEWVEGMAADPEGHELLALTRDLLPVADLEVAAHEPVVSSSINAFDLLAQTEAIRVMEGGSGHYLGTKAGQIAGAAGVAYSPGRAAFAGLSSGTFAHELGHNMSLAHAPCGGASGPDPGYPYPNASIGSWGYDFREGGRLASPARHHDLMSYCGPYWISDYHFGNALRFRLDDEGAPAPAPAVAAAAGSLLLWGGVRTDETPYLEPAFAVEAPSALPDSAGDYRLIGTDSDRWCRAVLAELRHERGGRRRRGFVLRVRSPGAARSGSDGLASITLTGPGGSFTLDGGERPSRWRSCATRGPGRCAASCAICRRRP